MIRNRNQMLVVIGAFILTLLLGTVTFAFFNYTRTGTANIIKTGRIYFNSEQGTSINLDNLFPIDPTETGIMNDATKVGTVTINVTGDTTYTGGIEYLVSAVNVENSVGSKQLPISIDVSYSANGNGKVIGTEDEEYFDNRGGNTSIYKVLAKDTISNNGELVVGYIARGATGIDGNIVIKAYIDKDKVAISDTYPESTIRTVIETNYSSSNCETILTGVSGASTYCATESSLQEAIDNEDLTSEQITLLVNAGIVEEYTNGTTNSWVGDRTVFTTTEWNSLQANGVSFQVKVEANEGTWVEETRTINAMNTLPTVITNEKANIKEVYFNKMGATRMQQAYDAATIKADLTYNNEGTVLAWLEENPDDNTMYNLIIASDGDTYLTNGNRLFAVFNKTEKILFNNINTSRLVDMSFMFVNCSSLKNLDLSSFDTSNVTMMQLLFNGCESLTDINLSSFNTENVVEMNNMFCSCQSLTSLDLSNFDTRNVTNMLNMFVNCSNLITIDLSSFDISSVTTTSAMFASDTRLTTIYVSNLWNMNSVSDSNGMFDGCTSLVGGNGTRYIDKKNTAETGDFTYCDKTYARIDGGPSNPGYLTLKTN